MARPAVRTVLIDLGWGSVLPEELLRLAVELARIDTLLDDPLFFAAAPAVFDRRMGRPSIPLEPICG